MSAKFEPDFAPDEYSKEEKYLVEPFFTNLNKSVYAPLIFSPELIGALCSRTSRAAEDLRKIYLQEFIQPFLNPERADEDDDKAWREKQDSAQALKGFIEFLHRHPITELFANPRARNFYAKWLAQFGDDSIAQMAGSHLVFSGITHVATKHIEDQRIGLAPLEKSTRYVNYSDKVNGRYRYYTDPTLKDMGLLKEYEAAMNNLFAAYTDLIPKLSGWLQNKFPDEKPGVVEKKAFDTLRGLLPTSGLTMVALFGNGQAFEYMISRCSQHPLGELRWAGQRAKEELSLVTPSFLKRLESEASEKYQQYLGSKQQRLASVRENMDGAEWLDSEPKPQVKLVEYDLGGEDKVITAMLFSSLGNHASWDTTLSKVKKLSPGEKEKIIEAYLQGRDARWQKVGRAFENTYLRFEIIMNVGAWRDLHRHRMLTQQRQYFTCRHGYDIPKEILESGLEKEFRRALDQVEDVFYKIEEKDPGVAQYAVALAHRMRFMQWQNLRSLFWTTELRTIPEGHPDYRHIEQEKFKALKKIYPLTAQYMMVNMGDYDFARRGQEAKIEAKLKQLKAENR